MLRSLVGSEMCIRDSIRSRGRYLKTFAASAVFVSSHSAKFKYCIFSVRIYHISTSSNGSVRPLALAVRGLDCCRFSRRGAHLPALPPRFERSRPGLPSSRHLKPERKRTMSTPTDSGFYEKKNASHVITHDAAQQQRKKLSKQMLTPNRYSTLHKENASFFHCI